MAKFTLTTLTILISMLLGSAGWVPGLAPQAARAESPAKGSKQFAGFFAPQGQAAPKRTEGGASRGRCINDTSQEKQALRLITPNDHIGLTAAARPVFLAYVDSTSVQQVFFSIKNEDESHFYEMTMALPPTSGGILKFQLPDNLPELEAGEQYLWSVALICGSKLGPDSPWASGWIQRVESESESALPKNASWLEQANYYGQAGLWYDTAAALAQGQLNSSDPEATVAWQTLLASQNLGHLSKQTLIHR